MELREGGRPPAVSILLSPLVRDLRRELGALTWVVFEDVALDAETTEAGCRAATSARRVAAHVGITAGTAASALQKLRRRGLLAHRRLAGPEGRFGLSVYEVVLPEGLALVPCAATPNVAVQHVAPTGRRGAPGDGRAPGSKPPQRTPSRRAAPQEPPQLRLIGWGDDEPA